MKNKKSLKLTTLGFTLVELLAVIVILGVILAIAIPNIINVIEKTRIDAIIKNEEMMTNAVKKYLVSNTNELPRSIGETKEIPLTTLVNNSLMDNIRNPRGSNNCNGYILVTKVNNTEYVYNPRIDCETNRGSVSSDSLILYYGFDDFQEPTVNELSTVIDTSNFSSMNGWVLHSGVSAVVSEDIYFNNHKVIKITPNSSTAAGIFATTAPIYPPNQDVAMSFWVYIPSNIVLGSDWGVHRHALPDGNCISGTCHWYSQIDYTNRAWNNNSPRNVWFRREIVIRTSSAAYNYGLRIFCYAYGANPTQGSFYITEPQIELKPYATPFVNGAREGVVQDYSGNGNNANLSLATTPRWIDHYEGRRGVYYFNGVNSTNSSIIRTNYNYQRQPEYSLSAWAYRKTNWDFQMIIGGLIGNNMSMGLRATNNERISFYTYDTVDKLLAISQPGDFPLNKWTHLIATIKYTSVIGDIASGNVVLYANGKEVARNSFSGVQLFDRNTIIGSPLTNNLNRAFEGYLDDVRIYNRVLSENEVRILYESTK